MAALDATGLLGSLIDPGTVMQLATNPGKAFETIGKKLQLQQREIVTEDDGLRLDHMYAHLSTVKGVGKSAATLMLNGRRITLLIFAEPKAEAAPATPHLQPAPSK